MQPKITLTQSIITDLKEQLKTIKDTTTSIIELNFDYRELALGTVKLQYGKN